MESGRKERNRRVAVLVVMLALITFAHYLTSTTLHHFHDIYQALYYIPIILASFWFGLKGGVITAAAASVLYLPHIMLQWGGAVLGNLERFLAIVTYNVVGCVAGGLSRKLMAERARYQSVAEKLDRSYDALKKRTEALVSAEEQLRRADRLSALGQLTAGLAHEVRNPLGSIKGTAEILSDHFKPGEKEYEFTRILIREVDRLNAVVTRFLEFSAPRQGSSGTADVNEVLQSVTALTQQEMKRSKVELKMSLQENLQAAADKEGLKQVFLNLIINAIQAMPEGGTVRISSGLARRPEGGRREDFISVGIEDTGEGLPQENIEKVFNPFFTTKKDGTGLGLSIAHRIISNHNGRIEVESTMGKGTKFTVLLRPGETKYAEKGDTPH